MGKRTLFLALVLILELGFLSFKSTYALFSDNATSSNNIFAAASVFPTPTPSPTPGPGSVVINELYYDVCTPAVTCGNNPQNEWVEIFNNTSSPIVLTGWTLTDDNGTDTLPNGTTIAANDFLVITPEVETFNIWTGVADGQKVILGSHIGGNGLGDNDDELVLKDNSATVIDAMSFGSNTNQLNPSVPDVVIGHSLERNPDGVDTDTAADFDDITSPTPGS